MNKFYFHDGTNEQGPFSLEELKEKKIESNTPVWYEGLPEWKKASEVELLKDILAKIPPPFKNPIKDIPTSQSLNSPLEFDKPKTKNKTLIIVSIILLAAVALTTIIYYTYSTKDEIVELNNKISTQDQALVSQQQKIDEQNRLDEEKKKANQELYEKNKSLRNNWSLYVSAENNRYTYSDLGGIYNLKITGKNNLEYLIDEMQVTISYIKANGDLYKSEVVSIYNIEPNSTKTVNAPESERGTSVEIEITNIISKSLHFCFQPGNWANRSDDPYFCKQ